MSECPFCRRVVNDDFVTGNDLAVAFADAFPISPGHMLVVPRRHEPDFFGLRDEEHSAMLDLVRKVRQDLVTSRGATGFNVGINAGVDAGQTVAHAHVHVIPRYPGDVEDPRGGVRWVMPDKAKYWR